MNYQSIYLGVLNIFEQIYLCIKQNFFKINFQNQVSLFFLFLCNELLYFFSFFFNFWKTKIMSFCKTLYAKQLMLTNLLKPISGTGNQKEYTCRCGFNGQSFRYTYFFYPHLIWYFLSKMQIHSIKPRSYYPCFIITYKNYFTYRYNEPLSQLQSILTLKQNRKCIVYITILINMSFFINSFF